MHTYVRMLARGPRPGLLASSRGLPRDVQRCMSPLEKKKKKKKKKQKKKKNIYIYIYICIYI